MFDYFSCRLVLKSLALMHFYPSSLMPYGAAATSVTPFCCSHYWGNGYDAQALCFNGYEQSNEGEMIRHLCRCMPGVNIVFFLTRFLIFTCKSYFGTFRCGLWGLPMGLICIEFIVGSPN